MTYESWRDGKRNNLEQEILKNKDLKIESLSKAKEMTEDKLKIYETKLKSTFNRYETANGDVDNYTKKIKELNNSSDSADQEKLKTYKDLWDKAKKNTW